MKHSSSGSIKKGVSRVHFEDELPVNNSNEPVRRTAQPSRLPLSNFETFLHLLKSLLGTGILAMPKAFFYAGWVVGVICSALIAVISTYCVHLLLRSQDEVCRRMKVCGLSYSDTAKRAMLEGPVIFVRMARSFSFITSLFLVIDQIGTCCVYIIFVASNLKEVFDLYTQPMDIRIYMVCILPPLLLLNYIRNLKYLAPFSTLANLIMLVSFGITFYYMFNDLPSISDRKVVGSVKEFPLFIGMVLFSMEAIAMVLPLRNDMRDPKWFGAHCGILNQVMVVLAIAYITTGFFGYMKYGDHTKGSITLNLPNTDGCVRGE
ncbi:UNVERIFIED_CONTAM: hypothetical protein PYX00_001407 [Menopon gallinae]|uniref:Amino acid transporter transmembrane domain-containing protein n=1 Tax=Menopon gallinae TaxID=328185 RepID=A0AAW2IEQ2_9NEOP